MKSTYINSQCYYRGNNGVLLPAVTTVLKATQTQESRNGLYYWRKKVGDAEANRITNTSRSRGNALHKMIQHHFQTNSLQPINNFIQPYWDSIQLLLKDISDVQLVEQVVPNYVETYAGKVDFVARYQGIPHVIEWTTAEEPKEKLGKLYDKPLQLTAYTGAINRQYQTNLFGDKIRSALIVVALPDQEAEVFQFDRTKLVYHWNQWLNRLQNFQSVAAA